MNRRLLLGLVSAAVLLGAGATSASAAGPNASHKICLDLHSDGRLLPPGYCIGWDDAAGR